MHGDYLFNFAVGQVRDVSVAEDVVQETFLAAFKARDRFAGQCSERTWLISILRHKIYDNVLPTSPDVSRDSQQLWWIDAKPYAKTPLLAQRVFHVEQFYCVIQVKDVKHLVATSAYLSQMNLTVRFTNTKP